MSLNKVLVPMDGSEFSRQILSQIRRCLNPNDNALILFHVTAPPHGFVSKPAQPSGADWWPRPAYASHHDAELAQHPIYSSQVQDSLTIQIEDEFESDVKWLKEAGYAVSVVTRFGEAAKEILDYVEQQNVDIVAMTTHGRTGLSRLVFGSVAEQVFRGVHVPVLVLRPVE